MNVVFMGTPDFAVPCLEKLIEKHNVSLVITQKDKPKGRGMKMMPTPVKACALEHNIPVEQPDTLKNGSILPLLKEYNPDIIVVVAYGKILPEYVLEYPKYKCINVHASLLPKYRGAAPIHHSIINGEKETGVTIMYMEKGLDTGDMIEKSVVNIELDDNAQTLHDKLSIAGATLLINTIDKIEKGEINPEKQDDSKSCYASMLTRELSEIDFNKTALEVHNKIRGLYPWPSAKSLLNGKTVKIICSKIVGNIKDKPGKIVIANSKDGIVVACKEDGILLETIQLEGGKKMLSSDYMKGHFVEIGTFMGE